MAVQIIMLTVVDFFLYDRIMFMISGIDHFQTFKLTNFQIVIR